MPDKKRPRKPEPQLTEEEMLWLTGSTSHETEFAEILPLPVPMPRVKWRQHPQDRTRHIPIILWDDPYPNHRAKVHAQEFGRRCRKHKRPRADALPRRPAMAKVIETPEGRKAKCPYCGQLRDYKGFILHTHTCRKRRGRPPKIPGRRTARTKRCPHCGIDRPLQGFRWHMRCCKARDGAPPSYTAKPYKKGMGREGRRVDGWIPARKRPKPPPPPKPPKPPKPPPKIVLCPRCGQERKEKGLAWHLYWCGQPDRECPHCLAMISAGGYTFHVYRCEKQKKRDALKALSRIDDTSSWDQSDPEPPNSDW